MHVSLSSWAPKGWLRFVSHPHLIAASVYAVIAITLLAPMASNTVLPMPIDHVNHVATIVQARMAIEEGQFPLRVAPWEHNHWQYPLFQFYSPLPYTVGGLVYRWVTPDNPFLAYKIVLWGVLLLAGLFTYLTANFLTRSRPAALLAGVAYMSAPYVLINVHARAAFTEAVAQAIVPAVLYCSLRCYFSRRFFSPWLFAAGISWSLLAFAHNITFVWGAFFVGLLFVLMAVGRRGVARGLWRVGAAFALGCLLALYFLAPVIAAPGYLNIHDQLGDVFATSWLTPISALLSPVSLPPEPQPNHVIAEHLHPAIGWPMLVGIGIVLYSWRSWPEMGILAGPQARRISLALLGVFGLALVATWTPVDFWSPLPPTAQLAQFTYRLLSQIAWAGALLFAYALFLLFRGQITPPQTAGCLLLIVLAHSTFLPPLKSVPTTIAEILRWPDVGYGRDAYLVHPRLLPADPAYGGSIDLADLYPGGTLKADAHVDVPRESFRACFGCQLHVRLLIPAGVPAGRALVFYVDGLETGRQDLVAGPAEFGVPVVVSLKDASAPPFVRFTASIGASIRSRDEAPAPADAGPVIMVVRQIELRGLRPKDTMPVQELPPYCVRLGTTLTCHLNVANRATNVQLPMLFYPKLLDVRVDGQPAPYFPVPHHGYLLATVRLEPGAHDLTARFGGLGWANLVSGVAWIGTIAGCLLSVVRREGGATAAAG
jgi:hypothetical protein